MCAVLVRWELSIEQLQDLFEDDIIARVSVQHKTTSHNCELKVICKKIVAHENSQKQTHSHARTLSHTFTQSSDSEKK